LEEQIMYKRDDGQLHLFDITMEGTYKLDPANRWVKKAKIVNWDKADDRYAAMFRKNGRPAKSIRMALGALIIQQTKGLSDEETVREITESPYLQFFIGLKEFTNNPPFDASLMTWFRKRLTVNFINEINEDMCAAEAQPKIEEQPKNEDDFPHGGTLILDASCAPANIAYPTDTGLLAEAIEKTDKMIDALHEPFKGKKPRPRTYRKKSSKLFKGFVCIKKPDSKQIRKVKGQQLNYLKRNLSFVMQMMEDGGELDPKQQEMLQTIKKLYQQQHEMYENRSNRVDDRIVSISQPHIRPIVRGKAGTPTEFGAKVHVSVVNGYTFLDEVSYDAYNEGELLENAITDYFTRFNMMPSKVLVDQAYPDRYNRRLCKDLGIKLMGKPLGRLPKDYRPEIDKREAAKRNEVEGKFGTLKTCYGWDRIMACLPETGTTMLAVSVFAMNLTKRAKSFLRFFCKQWFGRGLCRFTCCV
jgi:hypothetical protein